MDESIDVIQFKIGGKWSVEDMKLSLAHIEDLYNLRLFMQALFESWSEWFKWERYREPIDFTRATIFTGVYGPPPYIGPIPLESGSLRRLSKLLYPEGQLQLRRINYASPGVKDIAGFGEIVGHLKDFFLRIIELQSTQRQRELENEKKDLENQQLRIENARKLVVFAKECGYSEAEIKNMVNWVDERQETFVRLISNRQIRSVNLLSEVKKRKQ